MNDDQAPNHAPITPVEEERAAEGDARPPQPDGGTDREENPLLREGADALDAADIEDPERQL